MAAKRTFHVHWSATNVATEALDEQVHAVLLPLMGTAAPDEVADGFKKWSLIPARAGSALPSGAASNLAAVIDDSLRLNLMGLDCPRCHMQHDFKVKDLELLLYAGHAVQMAAHDDDDDDGAVLSVLLPPCDFAAGTGILRISRRTDGAWPPTNVYRGVDTVPQTRPYDCVAFDPRVWHDVTGVTGRRVVASIGLQACQCRAGRRSTGASL